MNTETLDTLDKARRIGQLKDEIAQLEAELVKELAERKVKSDTFMMTKSCLKKRNIHSFAFTFFAIYSRIDKAQLEEQVRSYIKANPMKYAPTSDRLTYIATK